MNKPKFEIELPEDLRGRLYFTKAQACRIANMSLRNLDYRIMLGELKVLRQGRRVMITLPSLRDFCAKPHSPITRKLKSKIHAKRETTAVAAAR